MLYLGLLCQDTAYVDRLIRYLGQRHGSELSALGFSSRAALEEHLADHKLDALLAEQALLGPEGANFPFPVGLLTDMSEAASVDGLPAVCKYQKAELIYKAALDLCASLALDGVKLASAARQALPVITFLGAAGGVGSTTLAVACARSLARQGLRNLYLNLEAFADFPDLLSDQGSATLSDVLYAIKSGQKLLRLKLESAVRRDGCGVWFYMPFQEALDFCSLSGAETRTLMDEILSSGLFDAVAVDVDAQPSPVLTAVLEFSRWVVPVTDGTREGNRKLARMLGLYRRQDESRPTQPLLPRFRVVYNKFGRLGLRLEDAPDVETLGAFPRFENADRAQIVQQLAERDLFTVLTQNME